MFIAFSGGGGAGSGVGRAKCPTQTVRQLLVAVAAELGVELKIQARPPVMMTSIGLFDEEVREAKEMLYQWDRPFLVDHSKFAARFWDDPTRFEVGIPTTAAWFRSRQGFRG